MTEASNISLGSFQARINEILFSDKSSILAGHKVSSDPVKYAFYLKKPLIAIGFTFQYRTALLATFKTIDNKTVIETSVQTPAFVTMSIALVVFWFGFDFFILKSTASIEGKVLFIAIAMATIIYHSVTKNKIKEAFEEEIMMLT